MAVAEWFAKYLSQWERKVSLRRATRGARHRHTALVQPIECLELRALLTFDIVFDYTYDSNGFFNPQERRDVLEQVASIYESRIEDDFTAITPGGVNSWTASFVNPSTGSNVTRTNLTIPADTIIIYVGARSYSGGLAVGGPGGFSVSGTSEFIGNLFTRGESGIDPSGNGTNDTDVALWGGTITFNTNTTWNFGLDSPSSGENDFLSVAVHELGHVLGFGTADSFSRLINGSNQFTGTETVAANGSVVAMHSDAAHFASGTMSTLPGTATSQEASMDPQITTGTRKLHTVLDWAVFDDIGWDVSPVAGPTDYGDAPDLTTGTGAGNYQTRAADNGPNHQIVAGLFIGTEVDADDGLSQDATASADDTSGIDDEDFDGSGSLMLVEGVSGGIAVNVTNTTGTAATLYGWVDVNADGVFSASESASVAVPSGVSNETVTLPFSAPAVGTAGQTFARFRLSSDAAASSPTGAASDGEVEDHPVTILTQPAAGDSLPLFTWSPVSGAVRYELEVDNVSTGQSQIILQSYLDGTSFRPPEGFPVGNYRWRYRPHDGTDFLAWSDYVSFSVIATSGTPFITDPVNSSIDSLPTFAWSPVENATRYELWVDRTDTGHSRIIHQTNLSGTSYTSQDGLAAGEYSAWVRAYNAQGPVSDWSAAFSFTLASSSSSVLTEPVGSSTQTNPTFGWLPTDASQYTLRVHNLSTSTSNVVLQENLSGTSYTLPEALPPGNYSATVQAQGKAISQPLTFQIEDVNTQTQFTSPVGSSDNPLPVFSWEAVVGATRYELWVDDVAGGISRVIHSSSVFDTSLATPQPLPPSDYRAWVRAFGSNGLAIGTWSSAVDFSVTESSFGPKIWTPNGTSDNAAPRIVWSNVTGATHYEVEFAPGQNSPEILLQQNVSTNWLQLDKPLSPDSYQVTVTAFSGSTVIGAEQREFVLEANTSTPVIYGPAGDISTTLPTISWSNVQGASRYLLWVDDTSRRISGVILENKLSSGVFTPNEPLLPGEYRMWVRAYNGSVAVGGWSAGVNFTVTESAGAPQIAAPLNNTTNSLPLIAWNAVTNAASYDVQIDDITGGQDAYIEQQGIQTTAYRPSIALSPGEYRVQVLSRDSGGNPSAWSDPFLLTIETAASATLVFPVSRSTIAANDLVLAWTTVSSATQYELWVNNLSTGQIKVIHETTLTGNSYVPASPLAAGEYRVWIRGIQADSTPTAWSPSSQFTISSATDTDALEGQLTGRESTLLVLSEKLDAITPHLLAGEVPQKSQFNQPMELVDFRDEPPQNSAADGSAVVAVPSEIQWSVIDEVLGQISNLLHDSLTIEDTNIFDSTT